MVFFVLICGTQGGICVEGCGATWGVDRGARREMASQVDASDFASHCYIFSKQQRKKCGLRHKKTSAVLYYCYIQYYMIILIRYCLVLKDFILFLFRPSFVNNHERRSKNKEGMLWF